MKYQVGFFCLMLLLFSVMAVAGFEVGFAKGAANEKDRCHAAQLQAENNKLTAVTKTLESFNQLADIANNASLALNKSISAKQLADGKSTQEIRHALQMSAPLRAACQFDNSIMQQLASARNRANASATSGFTTDSGRAVPSDNGTQ